jgi:hypothetical protein
MFMRSYPDRITTHRIRAEDRLSRLPSLPMNDRRAAP